MRILLAFLIGLLFALGLGVSGMTHPEKVLGFLDLAGAWDPALLFVMGAAVPIYLVAWRLRFGRAPWLGGNAPKAPRHDVDARLFIGASLFGIGWGLCGICPGPAIVNLGNITVGAFLFFAFVLLGMFIFRLTEARKAPNAS